MSAFRRLTELLPDRVTLEVLCGGHVHSYNTAPHRYERAVAAFSRRLMEA